MGKILDLVYKAVGTERMVKLNEFGCPTLVLLVDQNNYQSAIDFNYGIRRLVPEAHNLMVINIVDLRPVPKLLRSMARKFLRSGFDQGAAALPDEYDPWDYIIILPDWNGKIYSALQMDGFKKTVLIALHPHGNLFRLVESTDPLGKARQILRELKILPD